MFTGNENIPEFIEKSNKSIWEKMKAKPIKQITPEIIECLPDGQMAHSFRQKLFDLPVCQCEALTNMIRGIVV